MKYVKMGKDELEGLYKRLKSIFRDGNKYSQITNLVKKYFSNAHTILVTIDSEYNDETYDNRITSIFVYDKEEAECGLSIQKREQFQIEVQNLDLGQRESDEPMEDIVLLVSNELPEVYVKE